MVSEQEIVNEATNFMSEAKSTLDVAVRNKMKAEAYLGELTDLEILKNSLDKAQRGLSTLKKLRPEEVEGYVVLVKDLKKEIEKLEPKPKKEPITKISEPEMVPPPEPEELPKEEIEIKTTKKTVSKKGVKK